MTNFKQELIQAATSAGLDVFDNPRPDDGDAFALTVFPWPNAPHSLKVALTEQNEILARGAVRAFGLSGDRTDIHDIVGGLWAVVLQSTGKVLPFIMDELHEFAVNETYFRHLLIDPCSREQDHLPPDERTLAWLTTVFRATAAATPLITANFDDPHPETYAEKQPVWVPAVTALTGDDPEHGEVSVSHRLEGAMWQHFRSFTTGVSVYRLTPANMGELRKILRERWQATGAASQLVREAVDGSEERTELLERLEFANAIARAVDGSLAVGDPRAPQVVWMKSHLVAVGHASVVEVAWVPRRPEEDDMYDDEEG